MAEMLKLHCDDGSVDSIEETLFYREGEQDSYGSECAIPPPIGRMSYPDWSSDPNDGGFDPFPSTISKTRAEKCQGCSNSRGITHEMSKENMYTGRGAVSYSPGIRSSTEQTTNQDIFGLEHRLESMAIDEDTHPPNQLGERLASMTICDKESAQTNSTDPSNDTQRHCSFEQNNEGDTDLHLSIIHHLPEVFFHLLSLVPHNSVLNLQNAFGQTVLHLTVIMNQPLNARLLLCCGACMYLQDKQGRTALNIACEKGNLAMVQNLTRPLDEREFQKMPYEIPRYSIQKSYIIINFQGDSSLHTAARFCYVPIVKHLITECGMDINEQERRNGRTILHLAIEYRHENLIQYLLWNTHPSKININAQTYDGYTPVELLPSGSPLRKYFKERYLKQGVSILE